MFTPRDYKSLLNKTGKGKELTFGEEDVLGWGSKEPVVLLS